MKQYLKKTALTLMLPAIVYAIFLLICFERFRNPNCAYTIFLQSIIPAVTAYAYAFIYASGLFDFTIGSRIILSGLVGGILSANYGMTGLIAGTLFTSAAIAALTGLLNWGLKIPSLILTMALTMIYEILGKNISGRFSFVSIDYQYASLGAAPGIVIMLFLSAAAFYFLFYYTKFSYHMRAVGSSEAVAKNAGIRTSAVKCMCFLAGSLFVAVSAILTISQSGSMGAQTNLGSATLLFQPLMGIIIAEALQPACNMAIGIFISQFTLNTIFIGLIAAGLPDTFQNIVLGVFLLLVMLFSGNSRMVYRLAAKLKRAAAPAAGRAEN